MHIYFNKESSLFVMDINKIRMLTDAVVVRTKPNVNARSNSSSSVPIDTFFDAGEKETVSHQQDSDLIIDRNFSQQNGYDRLATLASQIQQTQTQLSRGIICANSSLASSYHGTIKRLSSLFGGNYEVPNLQETVSLQLSQVREYGACINEIISQTTTELKSTHDYSKNLARDIIKLEDVKSQLTPKLKEGHISQELRSLEDALQTKSGVENFLQNHDENSNAIVLNGEYSVASRASRRKREYLKHAYAVELLLIGSLTKTKQLGVDASCYATMLERLSNTYFNLGCNSTQLKSILAGMQTMQEFTDSMQQSVAQSLMRLDEAMNTKRTSVGSYLEKAVYAKK